MAGIWQNSPHGGKAANSPRRIPRLSAGAGGNLAHCALGKAGAHRRRAGHRQGADRGAAALSIQPLGGGFPEDELRRHFRSLAGKRTVRPRGGRLHRRNQNPPRPLRAGRRRHPLFGRTGHHLASGAGKAAAGDRVRRIRTGGRQQDPAHRRAPNRRHQPGPAALGRSGQVSRRPAGPSGLRRPHPAAPARPAGGHPAAGRALRHQHGPGTGAGGVSGIFPRRPGAPAGAWLARQRPRTEERGGALRLPSRRGQSGAAHHSGSVRFALPPQAGGGKRPRTGAGRSRSNQGIEFPGSADRSEERRARL